MKGEKNKKQTYNRLVVLISPEYVERLKSLSEKTGASMRSLVDAFVEYYYQNPDKIPFGKKG